MITLSKGTMKQIAQYCNLETQVRGILWRSHDLSKDFCKLCDWQTAIHFVLAEKKVLLTL